MEREVWFKRSTSQFYAQGWLVTKKKRLLTGWPLVMVFSTRKARVGYHITTCIQWQLAPQILVSIVWSKRFPLVVHINHYCVLGGAYMQVTASKRKADVCVGRSAQDSAATATVVSESWVLGKLQWGTIFVLVSLTYERTNHGYNATHYWMETRLASHLTVWRALFWRDSDNIWRESISFSHVNCTCVKGYKHREGCDLASPVIYG